MKSVTPLEKHLFIEAVLLKYGFDFRQYADVSMTRRLEGVLLSLNQDSLIDVLKLALDDKFFYDRILPLLTVGTTEFFRDPEFFKALRTKVFPVLRTYPTINVWLAGCSTGEEVYSLGILLREEGLADKATIYATDINNASLATARAGIYNLDKIKSFTRNYVEAGGAGTPSDYYTADYGSARMDPTLRENVVFSEHSLVTDSTFRECQLVLCRNVLIYFNSDLQARALQLFHESLVYRGFLALGSKETVRFSPLSNNFDVFDSELKIFQKNSNALTLTV